MTPRPGSVLALDRLIGLDPARHQDLTFPDGPRGGRRVDALV